MIVYFLVLTFGLSGYGGPQPQPVTIPQTYQTKEACEAAGIEALSGWASRIPKEYRGWEKANNFTCVPWNQEGD